MDSHNLKETKEGVKCVDCWEVYDTEEKFRSIECKSFRYKGPSIQQ